MTVVVDASVALRWYVDAPGSAAAAELLEAGEPLIAPELVVAEVANAAWRLARAGEISEPHGRRTAAAVPSAFDALVGAPRLVARAFDLARALDHPVYDCLYLALAEIESSKLVTADRRLIGRLEGSEWEALVRPLPIPDPDPRAGP